MFRILAFFFLLMVALGIHGYSLPMWHQFIDGSEANEVLVGKLRGLRTDDWLVDLPIVISQAKHQPKFPVVNDAMGPSGQNMMAPFRAPTRNFLLLFRPTTWGFVLGLDQGLAWMWWSLVFGVFATFFLVFQILTQNRKAISFWAAFALTFSPVFQFWSFYKAEVFIHAGLVFAALNLLFFSSDQMRIWIGAGLLFYNVTALMLDYIYPPYQVAAGYFILFLTIAFLWDQKLKITFESPRVIAFGVATILSTAAGFLFYQGYKDTLSVILNTVYPGQRANLGGYWPFWANYVDTFFRSCVCSPLDLATEWLRSSFGDRFFSFIGTHRWVERN